MFAVASEANTMEKRTYKCECCGEETSESEMCGVNGFLAQCRWCYEVGLHEHDPGRDWDGEPPAGYAEARSLEHL